MADDRAWTASDALVCELLRLVGGDLGRRLHQAHDRAWRCRPDGHAQARWRALADRLAAARDAALAVARREPRG